ncbi:MAG: hypothetical protein WCF65_09080 [Parachlamydiaceae bacterium]
MNILCPHFTLCSGCSLNIQVDQLPLIEEARSFFREKGTDAFPLTTGAPCGWRYRAKLAVRGSVEYPILGLFEKGSHQAVDIPECRVHHPAINKAAACLRLWIRDHGIIPYNEATGSGDLRYVQMTVEMSTGQVQLVLVFNHRPEVAKQKFESTGALLMQGSDLWHSIWFNSNQRRDNVIFGEGWSFICGQEWLWQTFCDLPICFHPASFFQANPEMYEALLRQIQRSVPQQASVVEFYAGAGVIGLTLAEQSKRVCCVEVVPLAECCFNKSYERQPLSIQEKLSFIRGTSAAQIARLKPPATVVVVDPPRKGLEPELLNALCATTSVEVLVYVSCGWSGFKRDCEALLKGGWKLNKAEGFLFFPGSDHLEVLAVFEKI